MRSASALQRNRLGGSDPADRHLAQIDLAGFTVDTCDDTPLLRRTGPVPGSADWTHQYGNVANTVCSKDQLAPPLGILWFGEESAFGDVLPRHGHGPPEQVVEGRLFIEGPDSLSARDVYTGRILWRRPLKGLGGFGVYYDATYKHDFRDLVGNQRHIPGANVRGTNFVATPDRIYVIQEAPNVTSWTSRQGRPARSSACRTRRASRPRTGDTSASATTV